MVASESRICRITGSSSVADIFLAITSTITRVLKFHYSRYARFFVGEIKESYVSQMVAFHWIAILRQRFEWTKIIQGLWKGSIHRPGRADVTSSGRKPRVQSILIFSAPDGAGESKELEKPTNRVSEDENSSLESTILACLDDGPLRGVIDWYAILGASAPSYGRRPLRGELSSIFFLAGKPV